MVRIPEAIDIPGAVLELVDRLEAEGHETWCVGGAIRDALLGDPHSDVDIATAALPQEVRRIFRRTVPIGVEHGTVGVLDADGVMHEVTTFRRDVRTDGRHAEVEFGASLDDDLARRDFTINAIAWHPRKREWRDPFGGIDDLRAGVVRAVGVAEQRFREDRLRILRAIRFATRLGFAIESETWAAARRLAADTGELSAERVRDEWWKSVARARDVREVIRLWSESGVAAVWLPELDGARDIPGFVLDGRDPILVLAAGCSRVEPVLRRFKCSSAEIARGRAIDRGPAAPESERPADVRRWMSVVGAASDDLAALAGEAPAASAWIAEVHEVRQRGEATTRAQLAVTGDDLVSLGVVESGPELGRLLARLLEAVLERPELNTREALVGLIRKWT